MTLRAVHQFASQVSQYDAVGNEVFALQELLKSFGLKSHIFCEYADPGLLRRVRWPGPTQLRRAPLLIHFSHGFPSERMVFSGPPVAGPRILLYHNITPTEFFAGAHEHLTDASRGGRDRLQDYTQCVDLALAHSLFSASELRQLGYPRVEVFPYVLSEQRYHVPGATDVLKRCGEEGWVNLLCVGRIAPHKRLEDTLLVFDYFKRVIERRSRLFIVGRWQGMEAYFARLCRLVAKLGLRDVTFTGPVPQAELAAYYETAHAFISMSEHEGFCVPVVEAMHYGVPVFAYAAAAVPETLGGAGLLFPEKNWPVIAESIGVLLSSPTLRDRIVTQGRARAASFSTEAARSRLSRILTEHGVL